MEQIIHSFEIGGVQSARLISTSTACRGRFPSKSTMASSQAQSNVATRTSSMNPASSVSSSFYDLSNASSTRQQYSCLYTKHKTQKRRVWQDGRLVLQSTRALLHDANPAPGSDDLPLGECEVTNSQRQALLQQQESRLETDKFLIQVEGPWVAPATSITQAVPTEFSSSMQKLLNRKFQKPKAYVPPHPSNRQSRLHTVLGKRRCPLQPGDLERIHHGTPQPQQELPPPPGSRLIPQGRNPYNRPPSMENRFPAPTMSQEPRNSQVPPQEEPNPVHNTSTNEHSPGSSDPYRSAVATASLETPPPPGTFGAPDSFVLQPANDLPLPQQSRTQANPGFVSNEFNATSFYGLDEEEEEDEPQQQHHEDQNRPPAWMEPRDQPSRQQHHEDQNRPPAWMEPRDQPSRQQEDLPESHVVQPFNEPITGANNKSNKVSGSQLLALFGAVPASDPSASALQSKNPSGGNSSSVNGPATGEFFLAPASQSSSEDSSQED
jgi:hypothetical protein